MPRHSKKYLEESEASPVAGNSLPSQLRFRSFQQINIGHAQRATLSLQFLPGEGSCTTQKLVNIDQNKTARLSENSRTSS